MKKLYIKLRQSGEVKEVVGVVFLKDGNIGIQIIGGIGYILGFHCDLCDEQGRLLVAEDDTQQLKDELLDCYRTKTVNESWSTKDSYFARLNACERIDDIETKLIKLNTPSEGKEEER